MSAVEVSGAQPAQNIDHLASVIDHLRRAVELLDLHGAPPELAGRVQEALDRVEQHRSE